MVVGLGCGKRTGEEVEVWQSVEEGLGEETAGASAVCGGEVARKRGGSAVVKLGTKRAHSLTNVLSMKSSEKCPATPARKVRT